MTGSKWCGSSPVAEPDDNSGTTRVPDPQQSARPRLGRLYLCTPNRDDLAEFVAAAIEGGVDMVQLRDKDLDARQVLERGAVVRDVCRAADMPFFVNDRPDLALELGADGVHVGQRDASATLVRRVVGQHPLVGLSTHEPAQLMASTNEPIDYVSTGPVVATPTKPGRPGVGIDYIRHAAEHSPHPFYVTGGVSPASVTALLNAGAARFVVVRWLTDARTPTEAQQRARELRDMIDG